MADDALEIADNDARDVVVKEGKDGKTYETFDQNHINRKRFSTPTRNARAARHDAAHIRDVESHIGSTIWLKLRDHGAGSMSRSERGGGVAGAMKPRAGIVAESYAAGAVVSEVARRHDISAQHLFAWRKAARSGCSACGGRGTAVRSGRKD